MFLKKRVTKIKLRQKEDVGQKEENHEVVQKWSLLVALNAVALSSEFSL